MIPLPSHDLEKVRHLRYADYLAPLRICFDFETQIRQWTARGIEMTCLGVLALGPRGSLRDYEGS